MANNRFQPFLIVPVCLATIVAMSCTPQTPVTQTREEVEQFILPSGPFTDPGVHVTLVYVPGKEECIAPGRVVINLPRYEGPTEPGDATQVVWKGTQMAGGRSWVIEGKTEHQIFEQNQFEIPSGANSVSSGEALDTIDEETIWQYKVRLLDQDGHPLCELDPEVCGRRQQTDC